jgi:toxin ParE1/3/4
MARVVVTASADADVAAIISDLAAKAGASVALRYHAEFDALYRRLEQFPESGAPRPALGRFVRIGMVSPYVVIHESMKTRDTVTIMRILHGRRRITRRLLARPTEFAKEAERQAKLLRGRLEEKEALAFIEAADR